MGDTVYYPRHQKTKQKEKLLKIFNDKEIRVSKSVFYD